MQSSLLPGKNRRGELPHRSSTAAREIQIKQELWQVEATGSLSGFNRTIRHPL
jgi:hypothetical protein